MEKVGIFCGHLEYITAIWTILCPFGNLEAICCIFPRFGILCQEKSGNPARSQKNTITFDNAYSAPPLMDTSRVTRDRCYDFLNIFAKTFSKKIGVFDSK
jgi:hypothetical protein